MAFQFEQAAPPRAEAQGAPDDAGFAGVSTAPASRHPSAPTSRALEVHATGFRFCPESPEGFSVELDIGADGCTVCFDGHSCDFADRKGAIDWALRAIGPECRLRTQTVGGKVRQWWLETTGDGASWEAGIAGGYCLLDFWSKPYTEMKRNRVQPDNASLRALLYGLFLSTRARAR